MILLVEDLVLLLVTERSLSTALLDQRVNKHIAPPGSNIT